MAHKSPISFQQPAGDAWMVGASFGFVRGALCTSAASDCLDRVRGGELNVVASGGLAGVKGAVCAADELVHSAGLPGCGADGDGDRVAWVGAAGPGFGGVCAESFGDDPGAGASVLGGTTRNSSPPQRPTESSVRSAVLSACPVAVSTASPAWWPRVSLTRLKWSMSISSAARLECCRRAVLSAPISVSSIARRLLRRVTHPRARDVRGRRSGRRVVCGC